MFINIFFVSVTNSYAKTLCRILWLPSRWVGIGEAVCKVLGAVILKGGVEGGGYRKGSL